LGAQINHIHFIYGLAFFALGLSRNAGDRALRAIPLPLGGAISGLLGDHRDSRTGHKLADGEIQLPFEPDRGIRLVIKVPLDATRGMENATYKADAG
jgi:hypothetical protein